MELGELRKRLEQLEEARNEPQEPAPVQITPDVVESIGDMVAEHGGIATLQWVLDHHPELEDVVFDQWIDQDDGNQALLFRQDYKLEKIKAEMLEQQDAAAPPPPGPEQQLVGVIAAVKPTVPDFDKLDLVEAAKNAPASIGKLLNSEDAEEQKDAVLTLVQFARATQAPKPASDGGVAGKLAAQVATGSLRPADGGEQPAETVDDRIRAAIAGQQATSVASGLTFAG